MDTPNMKCILNDLLKEKGWTQKNYPLKQGYRNQFYPFMVNQG